MKFEIAPEIDGKLAPGDLTKSDGHVYWKADKTIASDSRQFFFIEHGNFYFRMFVDAGYLCLERNGWTASAPVAKWAGVPGPIQCLATWRENYLSLSLGRTHIDAKSYSQDTPPTAPPAELIIEAQRRFPLATKPLLSGAEFRAKVYACIDSLNMKIAIQDSYVGFWDIEKNGHSIVSRKPKAEPDAQKIIDTFLSDQMLQNGITMHPQFHTGTGDLDLLLQATLQDGSIKRVCVEYKNAHSDDLIHGLTEQLPKYMKHCQTDYGAYCVLNYQGEWFSKPSIDDLNLHLIGESLEYQSAAVSDGIRIFVIDLAKPKTASKK